MSRGRGKATVEIGRRPCRASTPDEGRIFIGTSGWHYGHWRGPFYPADMRSRGFLSFYAARFTTVEINNSFYRLPAAETFESWAATVGEGFVFAVKASRFITHMKKLKDPAVSVKLFMDRVRALGDHLGPILFQLPPRWGCNPGRLDGLLTVLPRSRRYAFEFRDPSWFDGGVLGILRKHGAAFCIYDFDGRLSPREVTADFVYIRLHGPGRRYQGSYSDGALEEWANAIRDWAREGRDVYCYFDNDQSGYAALNALRLKEILRAGRKLSTG